MPAEKPFTRKRCLHDCARLACELAGWCLLPESKVHIGKTLLFLKDPFLRRRFSQKGDVLEKHLYNLLVVFETIFSQSNLTIEYSRCSRTHRICACKCLLAMLCNPSKRHGMYATSIGYQTKGIRRGCFVMPHSSHWLNLAPFGQPPQPDLPHPKGTSTSLTTYLHLSHSPNLST